MRVPVSCSSRTKQLTKFLLIQELFHIAAGSSGEASSYTIAELSIYTIYKPIGNEPCYILILIGSL